MGVHREKPACSSPCKSEGVISKFENAISVSALSVIFGIPRRLGRLHYALVQRTLRIMIGRLGLNYRLSPLFYPKARLETVC